MKAPEQTVTRRGDYRAPAYWVDRVELVFELDPLHTRVVSTLTIRRNPAAAPPVPVLELDGVGLTLHEAALNGVALAADACERHAAGLRIALPDAVVQDDAAPFQLRLTTRFNPSENLALEGLYVTNGSFCTQCEAEGFRRITYFPDRPDILSEYHVTLRASRADYPVLLCNGNLLASRELGDGRHEAVWHDPHRKPAYLFALVAGKLDRLQDQFVTRSGRTVLLEIYSTAANLPRCRWAMQCLKAAMRWDETAYGREYDLDRFMIYAADDFNMGAMENKGLNIFNSRYLLADQATATDADFLTIDAIIAHEYFHNWSGNRVTCRDWFQLSLKEGFTVFREQQYTATRSSPAVVRIDEAAFMQSRQFAQDAGPMAHPIRPDEYEVIDNFYTVTVYEKGAEVIRMLHTLLGAGAFRRGSDLYFDRHDGTAATCDDFVAAMQVAGGCDLTRFARWYSQAGTPELSVRDEYDSAAARYTLHVAQSLAPTPGQPDKQPMVIPLAVALLVEGDGVGHERVLHLTQTQQSFHFDDVPARPVPSLLRGFSAPVRVRYDYSDAQLAALVVQDNDGITRWQAVRELFFRAFDALAAVAANGVSGDGLNRVVAALLRDHQSDPALLARLLSFPSSAELADRVALIDPQAIAETGERLLCTLAHTHRAALIERYGHERAALAGRPWSATPADAAHRELAGVLLALLNTVSDQETQSLALDQWQSADNLTDVMHAMTALRDQPCAARDAMYAAFHDRWQDDLTMLNRWFTLQASAKPVPPSSAVANVQQLLRHPRFDGKNPNRVRAVVQSFAEQNWAGFHAADGAGYRFVAGEILRFDRQNPSLATRFCDAFTRWHKCAGPARSLQQQALLQLAREEALSANVREVVEKALRAGPAA